MRPCACPRFTRDAIARALPAFAAADVVQLRRGVCQTCPEATSQGKLAICMQCGCFIRAKTKLAAEACPLAKWPAEPAQKKASG